jgi:hypothetical protein
METPIKEKKTADMNKYMSSYMKKKYAENPTQHRNYKNSLNMRKKYVIDDKIWDKYKDSLYAVITLKETIDTLPEGTFEKFLMDYKNMHFQKRTIDI